MNTNTEKLVREALDHVSKAGDAMDNRKNVADWEKIVYNAVDDACGALLTITDPIDEAREGACGVDEKTGAIVYHQSEYERLYWEERHRREKLEDDLEYYKKTVDSLMDQIQFLGDEMVSMIENVPEHRLSMYFQDMAWKHVHKKGKQ